MIEEEENKRKQFESDTKYFQFLVNYQLQQKSQVFRQQDVRLKMEEDCLQILTNINVVERKGDIVSQPKRLTINLLYSNILSIAKCQKNPGRFELILFLKGSEDQEQYDFDEEDEEEQDNQTMAFLNKAKSEKVNVENSTLTLAGSFTLQIAIIFQKCISLNSEKLIQIEKKIHLAEQKEKLVDHCHKLYEEIINRISQCDKGQQNRQNNNNSIANILNNFEAEQDDDPEEIQIQDIQGDEDLPDYGD